jgi:hypothetical protein
MPHLCFHVAWSMSVKTDNNEEMYTDISLGMNTDTETHHNFSLVRYRSSRIFKWVSACDDILYIVICNEREFVAGSILMHEKPRALQAKNAAFNIFDLVNSNLTEET